MTGRERLNMLHMTSTALPMGAGKPLAFVEVTINGFHVKVTDMKTQETLFARGHVFGIPDGPEDGWMDPAHKPITEALMALEKAVANAVRITQETANA